MRAFILLLGAGLAVCLAGATVSEVEAGRGALVLYVHDNSTPNRVFGFDVSTTGELSPLAGSPFSANNTTSSCGGPCQTLTFFKQRRLLFATGGNGISVFRVAGTGALTLVPGSPFGAFFGFGVHALKRAARAFVYASEESQDRMRGFEIQDVGTLVELGASPFPSGGDGPLGATGVKSFLFAANENNDQSVSAFKVKRDGTLAAAPGSPFTDGSDYFSVYVDTRGKFIYTAECDGGRIYGFRVDPRTAALTPLPGSPFGIPILSTCGGLALTSKPLMFALGERDGGLNDIQALRRAGSGALTVLGTPQSSGVQRIESGALDMAGRFLAVASSQADQLKIFRVNAATGELTQADNAGPNFGTDVNAVVFAQP